MTVRDGANGRILHFLHCFIRMFELRASGMPNWGPVTKNRHDERFVGEYTIFHGESPAGAHDSLDDWDSAEAF
jgi:hypothetical protein